MLSFGSLLFLATTTTIVLYMNGIDKSKVLNHYFIFSDEYTHFFSPLVFLKRIFVLTWHIHVAPTGRVFDLLYVQILYRYNLLYTCHLTIDK